MSTELVTYNADLDVEQRRFMPVMSMATAVERREMIVDATKRLMAEGIDFGKIPGTKGKPTLLQPGADKLCNLFGLTIKYEVVEKIKDWTGAEHGGEPFFYYEVKGLAYRGDVFMGEGIGSCNSWESKYRYRQGERLCPHCGKAAIIKGKAEYGGGWICFTKRDGCGAKFADGDPAIEGQEVGRKQNPEIYDQVNTIQKIAYKRTKISTTINATSASEFFTQDMEDFAPEPEAQQPERPPVTGKAKAAAFAKGKQTAAQEQVMNKRLAEMEAERIANAATASAEGYKATDEDLPEIMRGEEPPVLEPPEPAYHQQDLSVRSLSAPPKPWNPEEVRPAFEALRERFLKTAQDEDPDSQERVLIESIFEDHLKKANVTRPEYNFAERLAAKACYKRIEAQVLTSEANIKTPGFTR